MNGDWKSESIDKLAPALLEAQRKLAPVMKEFRNPAFPKSKYADLNAVLMAVNDAFHPNGLFLSQLPMPLAGFDGGIVGMVIKTVVMHTSGQWIASDLPMCPDMTNPQKIGGCVTYGRRYGAVAAAGLMQEDDDGETATGRGSGHDYQSRPATNGHAEPNGNGDKQYPPPTKGTALYAWAKKQSEAFDVDLVKWLDKWGQHNNLPGKYNDWSTAEIKRGYDAAVSALEKRVAPATASKGEAYEGDLP